MPIKGITDNVRATMQDTRTATASGAHAGSGLTAEQLQAADQVDAAKDALVAENTQAMNQGMTMLSYLLSGVIVYGGLGWLGDHFLHTGFLLPTGIILGSGLAIFMIIRRATAQEAERAAGAVTATKAERTGAAHDATDRDGEDC